MSGVAIPDYAAQGPWRSTERPEASDLAAVLVDYTGDTPRLCEAWNFDWRWWTGPTARHGGCMPYDPSAGTQAFPWPMGSQASGLRYIDGVVTVQEWRAWVDHGDIPDHELQVAVPLACRTFRAPANRSDGNAWATPDNSDCIEYGTLYTLPASYPTPTDCHERQVAGCVWSSFVRLAVAMAKLHGIRRVTRRARASWCAWRTLAARIPIGAVTRTRGFDWATSEGRDNRLMRQFPWGDLRVQ
jgi:hypothetical protein